jgi:S-(hydroxymethyl)glutathione dehydrogenase / alcohol dehydrogenase
VRVAYAGVCHSDLHFIDGIYPGRYPMVLGHEVSGVVEAVGPGVTSAEPGDRVIMAFIQPCGHCKYCDSGRQHLCATRTSTRPADQPALRRGDEPVTQMANTGGFAQYSITQATGLIPVPDDVGLDIAALIGCSVTTGYGAVVRAGQVEQGSTVAVLGCGGVGLNIIQTARLAGAARIIAVDVAEHKLQTARHFGATDLVNAGEGDPVEAVRELTGGGVEFAFEAIGLKATAEQAHQMLERGGTAVIVGMVPPGQNLEISGMIWREEKTLKGAAYGSARFHVDMPRIFQLYQQGRLDLDSLVTKSWPLEGINEAFDLLRRGEVTRQVLEIGGE